MALLALVVTWNVFAQPAPNTLASPVAPKADSVAAHSPRMAVMDFGNASAAPARVTRLISERIRLGMMQSGRFRTVDVGHLRVVCSRISCPPPDSLDSGNVVRLGAELEADYLITGFVSYYREGDIELRRGRIELIGKLFRCSTGELVSIESVKVSGKGDADELAGKASRKLADKLMKRVAR